MKKLLVISGAASPHMVKFIPYLRKYYDAEFWFYEMPLLGRRQDWWRMDLGEHGHVVTIDFQWKNKLHFSRQLWRETKKFNPDIVLLGGFAEISNYLIYRWAKKNGKRAVVFTEASRDLKTRRLKPYNLFWRIVHFLYRDVDMIMTTQNLAIAQFRDVFHFGAKVIPGWYPSDIDRYFFHPMRGKKDSYILIFPNRLTDNYNPLAAVEIFEKVLRRYPRTKLRFNAAGDLRAQVEDRVNELGISHSVEFLDHIRCWDELGDVYASSDIMILPAKFSTGNYTITECMVSGMACLVSTNVKSLVTDRIAEKSSGQVLSLDLDLWAEKICWYIEHPDEFARIAVINRNLRSSATMENTAKFYYEKLG